MQITSLPLYLTLPYPSFFLPFRILPLHTHSALAGLDISTHGE